MNKLLFNGKDVLECNASELHEASAMLNAAFRAMQKRAASKFFIGQFVQFTASKTGRRVIGRIDSINQKTISLHEIEPQDNNGIIENFRKKWRVSPSMLSLYNG